MNQPPSYLDELDELLLAMSDDGMLLSELDGYMTGMVISPDLVPQSSWLKPIWGDAPPRFESDDALHRFLDLIMQHHNGILTSLAHPGRYEPVLDSDTMTGEILWELWIDGFTKAMTLAPRGWNRVRASEDEAAKAAMTGIATLAAINDGRAGHAEEEEARWDREASDLSRSGCRYCMNGGWKMISISQQEARSGEMMPVLAGRGRNIRNAAV